MKPCNICGKNFKSHLFWKDHLEKHVANFLESFETFECSLCDKKFVNENLKNVHIWKHLKSVQCNDCGKTFNSQTDLMVHQDVHEKVKNYKCEHCGKSFISESYLEKHISVHDLIRSLPCEYCQKVFSKNSDLRHHIDAVHKGIKNHVCTKCGKGFVELFKLRNHVKIVHEAKRKFKCDLCHKDFDTFTDLKYHISKKHCCEICGKSFRNHKCEKREKIFLKIWQSSHGMCHHHMPKYFDELFMNQTKFEMPKINAKSSRQLDMKLCRYIIYNAKQNSYRVQTHVCGLGDNNLRYKESCDTFIECIEYLATEMSKIKNCYLILVSLIPSLLTDNSSKRVFREANSKMKSLSEKFETVSFLDISKNFVKNQNIIENLYANDKIHLSEKGAKLYVQCVKNHIFWKRF